MLDRGQRLLDRVCRMANLLGIAGVVAMMLLTCADVLMRDLLRKPVPGSYELIQLIMVGVAFLTIPYGWMADSHLRVDMFWRRFSPKHVQPAADAFAALVALSLLAFGVWKGTALAIAAQRLGETSDILSIPMLWPKLLLPFGCALLGLQVTRSLIVSIRKLFGKGS